MASAKGLHLEAARQALMGCFWCVSLLLLLLENISSHSLNIIVGSNKQWACCGASSRPAYDALCVCKIVLPQIFT